MLSALGVERRILNEMRRLGLRESQLCALIDGLSPARLNRALNGLHPLENEIGKRVEGMLREIGDLAAEVAPARLDFRDILSLKAALEKLRQRRKRIAELERDVFVQEQIDRMLEGLTPEQKVALEVRLFEGSDRFGVKD